MENIRAISTEEKWEFSDNGKRYVVTKIDNWQDGDQKWTVFEKDGVFEKYLHLEHDKEEIHKIVRLVQNHLVQR